MKYSIITPYYNPTPDIINTINSVKMQMFTDYEHILVNDGSDEPLPEHFFHHIQIAGIDLPKHSQRVVARNAGMKEAVGEWIIWLDADDFMFPYYLELMNQLTMKYPDTDVFNFGGVICANDWGNRIASGRAYHKGEVFKSGGVMTGGFMFRRSCLDKTGLLPEGENPYVFGAKILEEFPEVKPLYKEGQMDLGNPWGDDWAMFYKLTRHFEPVYLNAAPYMVMVRNGRSL